MWYKLDIHDVCTYNCLIKAFSSHAVRNSNYAFDREKKVIKDKILNYTLLTLNPFITL